MENQAPLNYFWKTKTTTWQRNETSKSNGHTAQPYAVLPVLMYAHSHPGQKKRYEKLRNKCEIGFCDQLLKLGLRTLILATKYRGTIRAQWCSD